MWTSLWILLSFKYRQLIQWRKVYQTQGGPSNTCLKALSDYRSLFATFKICRWGSGCPETLHDLPETANVGAGQQLSFGCLHMETYEYVCVHAYTYIHIVHSQEKETWLWITCCCERSCLLSGYYTWVVDLNSHTYTNQHQNDTLAPLP